MYGLLLALGCVLALGAGLALGRAARAHWDGLMPRWLPAAALVPGLLPLAWHFRRLSDFIAPVPELQWSAAASELEMVSLVLPFAVVAVWALAIPPTRRFPAAAMTFPALATSLYLAGVTQAAPLVGEVAMAQSSWLSLLIASQVPATLTVAGFLWAALGRTGVVQPWALRLHPQR